jgi:hypothetical protein
MGSPLEKVRKIIRAEESLESRYEEGDLDGKSVGEVEEIEESLLQLLELGQEDLKELISLLRRIKTWEENTDSLLESLNPDINELYESLESFQLESLDKRRREILKIFSTINSKMEERKEKVSPEEVLSEEQAKYFEELRALESGLDAEEELDFIVERLENEGISDGELEERRKKLETLRENLEPLKSMDSKVQSSEIDHSEFYKKVEGIKNEIQGLENTSVFSEKEVKAMRTTIESLENLIKEVGEIEDGENGMSRRNFLKLAAASTFVGLEAAAQVYQSSIEKSNGVANQDLGHTERFLYSYYREISSYLERKPREKGRHTVIGENHNYSDGIGILTEFVKREKPDAVGLEFFYEKDEHLKRFNMGETGVEDVLNHWVRTEEQLSMLGRDRPEQGAARFLEAVRQADTDLIGLEWQRRGYYPGSDKILGLSEKQYRKRSLMMSEIASKIASRYDSTAYFVGLSHANLGMAVPFRLLRAAKPHYSGKFNVEDLYSNPYLTFKHRDRSENENGFGKTTKNFMDFYRNPKMRIEDFLRDKGFSTDSLMATSAQEHRNILNMILRDFPRDKLEEKTTSRILENINSKLDELRGRQPLKTSSERGFDVTLRQPVE